MADSPTEALADLIESELAGDVTASLCMDDREDRLLMAQWIAQRVVGARPIATFTHPEPPPSANNLYFIHRGRKVLSDKGRKWKTIFKATRGGLSVMDLARIDLDYHSKIFLDVWIYLDRDEIYAKTYGKNKRVKYPMKKVDTSNFFKLAEDCVADLLGTVACDRQNFKIVGHKKVADHRGRRIVIHVRPYKDEIDFFDRH